MYNSLKEYLIGIGNIGCVFVYNNFIWKFFDQRLDTINHIICSQATKEQIFTNLGLFDIHFQSHQNIIEWFTIKVEFLVHLKMYFLDLLELFKCSYLLFPVSIFLIPFESTSTLPLAPISSIS